MKRGEVGGRQKGKKQVGCKKGDLYVDSWKVVSNFEKSVDG